MKKWLTGLLSGSSDKKEKAKTDAQKKGSKEMSKSKPVKAAAKTAKPAKPVAKAKPALKAPSAKETKAKAPSQVIEKTKPSISPKKERPAEVAAKAEKKPKKVAAKEAEATPTSATGLVDTASPENKKKWRELRERFAKEKAPAYSMSAQFEASQPLEHKVLGWGYIISNNSDRLEVLFETGIKILISNYRA